MPYFVYIMTNKRSGTLYVGVTNDLERRVFEHKDGKIDGFTKKYQLHRLVHYEQTTSVEAAITREKQLKNWRRSWKLHLIEQNNADWRDLSEDFN